VIQSENASLPVGAPVQLCQVHAGSSGMFELAENPFENAIPAKVIPAKVQKVSEVAQRVYLLRLVMPPNQILEFRGGQYASIILKSGLSRKYSIAEVDASTREIDFYVKLVPRGAFGQWLSESAKPGDLVRIRAPFGTFFLRSEPVQSTWLVATGTGIVPIYAMLKRSGPHAFSAAGVISLLWGNRYFADVFLRDELSQLCRDRGVSLELLFTREATAPARRVTDRMANLDNRDSAVYAAGHPGMVQDIRKICLQNNMSPRRYHADAFTFSGAEQTSTGGN
jgi:CDP-4-dehydro-6-deoxyglucose reductase